jgi:DNA ligase-4
MDDENNAPSLNSDNSKVTYVGSKIMFKSFCGLLEQMSKIDESNVSKAMTGVGKNEEKKRILQKFHQFWLDSSDKMRENTSTDEKIDDNYYPVLRLLLPYDDRRVYGLKENRLAKCLIDALCIAPKSDDAQKLLNYRAPTHVRSEGDFASVAYFVLKNRCQEDSTLTIHEVNHHLDIISMNNAKGKEGLRDVNNSLKHLLVNLSALQLKWLIRIIIKEMKIGTRENVILDSFHPDAIDLYNCTSSLDKVCHMLRDPNKRLHEVAISIFTPFRPMLGKI